MFSLRNKKNIKTFWVYCGYSLVEVPPQGTSDEYLHVFMEK